MNWIRFYEKFADIILTYRHNRKHLLEMMYHITDKTDTKNRLTYNYEPVADICPFSIFGVFNQGEAESRKRILEAISEEFWMTEPVPVNFDGIPVLSSVMSSFFYEDLKDQSAIEALWDLFDAAIRYGDGDEGAAGDFAHAFDLVHGQIRERWKITYGLYWIRPNTFIPMDEKTRSWLYRKGSDSNTARQIGSWQEAPTGYGYLEGCRLLKQEIGRGNFDEITSISQLVLQAGKGDEKEKSDAHFDDLFFSPEKKKREYSKEDFLEDVYLSEEEYDTLVFLLKRKKNIILQGAPGVGKTFAAKRLAYSMMGEKDESCVMSVQFHQSYSYEDFIIGYKPYDEGFRLVTGVFYDFCKMAEKIPEKTFYCIIDEINRGNLSKIFGELLMLIENDKRGDSLVLPSNGEEFTVPENVYLIGMMNTADRSLAMIDYALRRRFSFYTMHPAFDHPGFKEYQRRLGSVKFDRLIDTMKELNVEIKNDMALREGFVIGHSYFCNQKTCTDEWLREMVEYDMIPILQEYWFDDEAKVKHWSEKLRSAISG